MMVCECVSPPPKFDIPPPPDPSLIWHLLSDEPADEFTQIQQCDVNQKAATTSHNEVSSAFSDLPDYLVYALLASGALISAALLVIIIYIRLRRLSRKGQRKTKRKSEFPADFVLSNNDWPYTTTIQSGSSVINGDLLYGSTENNFIKHKAIRVTSNSLRSCPYHSSKLSSTNSVRKSPLQTATIFRIRGSSDGYCTIGRLYEEIPGNGTFNAASSGNPITYASRRELLYCIPAVRRPPPTCRPPPPPPPPQGSPLSLDSSGNSVEKENDVRQNASSLKRFTDDEKSRNSGNSGDNGHESGYGTAPSRSWNSPMIMHQQKRNSFSESDDIFRRQTPLTVYTHHSNAHPMTYV